MAYYRSRTPQTPAQRRTSAIILIAAALITLAVGFFRYTNYNKLQKNCSAVEIGSVTDVDMKTKYRRSRHGGSYDLYKAQVKLIEGNAIGLSSVTSDWTRHRFSYGDAVRVYYDPTDTYTYYVDGAEPDNGLGMFAVAGVLMIMGVYSFIKYKKSI